MTLIEVVAGIAILGSLIALMVVGRAKYLYQWSNAEQKQTAVDAANALLISWSSSLNANLQPAQGTMKEQHLYWRTSFLRDDSELGARVMRLEICAADEPSLASKRRTLAKVDFIVDMASTEKHP